MNAIINSLQSSVTRRLIERRNDQWSATLETLDHEDQSKWRTTKRLMRITPPSRLVILEEIALKNAEEAEGLADNLDAQFKPMYNLWCRQLLRQ